jgi:hypothetical protein
MKLVGTTKTSVYVLDARFIARLPMIDRRRCRDDARARSLPRHGVRRREPVRKNPATARLRIDQDSASGPSGVVGEGSFREVEGDAIALAWIQLRARLIRALTSPASVNTS